MTPSTLPGSESVQAVRLKAYRLALTLGSLASVPGSSPNDLAARIGMGADALDELRALIEAAALPVEAQRVLAAFHAAYEGPDLASVATPDFLRTHPLWSGATPAAAVVPDPLDEFSIYIAKEAYPDTPRKAAADGEAARAGESAPAPAADGPEPAPEADPAQDLPVPTEEPGDELSDAPAGDDNPFAPQAQPGDAASI